MERVPNACTSFIDIEEAFVSFIATKSPVSLDLQSVTEEKHP